MKGILLTLILAAPCCGVPILDQINDPEAAVGNGSISVDSTTTTWQQGVVAGMDGQLMAIDVYKGNYAPRGNGQFHFNLYLGEAWQRDNPVFESVQTHPGDDWLQTMAIDVSSAGIMLQAGDQFSIELRGTSLNNGVALRSSYAWPVSEYVDGILWMHSEFIWGGPQDTDGSDLGFRTWMEPPPGPGDFNADGLVDDADLALWQAGFGTDYDGCDLLAWQRNRTAAAAVASVPEPDTVVLMLVVVLSIMIDSGRVRFCI